MLWLFSLGYHQIPSQLLPHSSSSSHFPSAHFHFQLPLLPELLTMCLWSVSIQFASTVSSSSLFTLLRWGSFPQDAVFQEQHPLPQALHRACSSAWSNLFPSFLPDLGVFTAVSLTFCSLLLCVVFSVLSIFFQRCHQHGCWAQLWPVVALELPESAQHRWIWDWSYARRKETSKFNLQATCVPLGDPQHSETHAQD